MLPELPMQFLRVWDTGASLCVISLSLSFSLSLSSQHDYIHTHTYTHIHAHTHTRARINTHAYKQPTWIRSRTILHKMCGTRGGGIPSTHIRTHKRTHISTLNVRPWEEEEANREQVATDQVVVVPTAAVLRAHSCAGPQRVRRRYASFAA